MALINGQLNEKISINDRGLTYGDGVFETIAVNQFKPIFWQQHLQRLQRGCERLKIPFPSSFELNENVRHIITRPEGILKIIFTRGEGGRGFQPPTVSNPNCIINFYSWPVYPQDYPTAGITAKICQLRLAKQPYLAGIKHLNRLEQVLAAQEIRDNSCFEGILFDTDDFLVEGIKSNIFLVNDTQISTPALTESGIAGIIREEVLTIIKSLNLKVFIGKLTADDLLYADEVFITNSIIGLWPVKSIAEKIYNAREITHYLQRCLQARMEQDINENKLF